MKNDILPPVRPERPEQSEPSERPDNTHDDSPDQSPKDAKLPLVNPEMQAVQPPPPAVGTPDERQQAAESSPRIKRPNRKKLFLWIVVGLLAFTVLAAAAVFMWYQSALRPVAADGVNPVRVTIEKGSSPAQIGRLLDNKNVIRSQLAFDVYTRMNDVRNKLQAGTFSLSPADSTPEIVSQLTSGKVDRIEVTFYPGATLRDNTDTPSDEKVDHRTALIRAGYAEEQIEAAFSKEYPAYSDTLFKGKPASAGLEGYIYGETYHFPSTATVEDIIRRALAELEQQVVEHDLIKKYQAQGLTLYEGITLASIIQREVSANPADQRQVAQVFYKRLAQDMPLGADATFIYAANILGAEPTIDIDSPYNTRKYGGLPPGPISSPGLSALLAVANPAKGDYLYFVSGDDGTNHFSRTLEEHEAKTRQYCQENCSLF